MHFLQKSFFYNQNLNLWGNIDKEILSMVVLGIFILTQSFLVPRVMCLKSATRYQQNFKCAMLPDCTVNIRQKQPTKLGRNDPGPKRSRLKRQAKQPVSICAAEMRSVPENKTKEFIVWNKSLGSFLHLM